MWKPGTTRPESKAPKPKISKPSKDNETSTKYDNVHKSNTKKASAKFVLSQKTLAMKFMQRKQATAAQRAATHKIQQRPDTWESTLEDNVLVDDVSNIICICDVSDPSLSHVFGRRSFGSFNRGVEDEFKKASRALPFDASEEAELREEISAQEMTSRMLKYTGLGRRCSNSHGEKRRNGKRQRK
ncbi:hypothetical protein PsorP6_007585 [Peronosclerospora sorghi]|uniref:Uncharacterized protein n=1 Tax=Peronosclerospora sorghi TaxID=230839 RepID=A0ACC0W6U2_9STRA|nr:hypothetical protein PsorP6_007585 [Peronosclerospora sorghi]